jgi:Xaa-Pro aminopeptidase
VRIEDNIRVVPGGCENMTEKAPKLVSELESVVGSARQ